MPGFRPITDYDAKVPHRWAALPLRTPENADWADQIALALCDDRSNSVALLLRLLGAHPRLISTKHVGLGIWVPDHHDGEIRGLLVVDWLTEKTGPALTRTTYRNLFVGAKRRRDVRVLDQEETDLDLPAGPAIRVRERIEIFGLISRRRRTVQEGVIFTVFPPGSSDVLQFVFTTNDLDFADAMAKDADGLVQSLDIKLGDLSAVT